MKDKYISISYKIPNVTSKCRVKIWRELKEYGMVSISNGTSVIPYSSDLMEKIKDIASLIKENGGQAVIGIMEFEEQNKQEIVNLFTAKREEEFMELQKECNKLVSEITWLIDNSKFRFSELEENEEELKKLRNWFQKICDRDFFKKNSSVVAETKQMLAKASLAIQEYGNRVYCSEK